ncbi:HAD family hydrolase [Puteibacter caeruleilacunae]|nr:HAD family hydrolase [Puteibacter caeruleilacunae]
MTTQYKAVIFDLDGTLLDSAEDLADSMNTVLSKYNLPTHSIDTYKSLLGKGLKKFVQESLPEELQQAPDCSKYEEDMYETYNNNCTVKTKPYEGITTMLDLLKAKNIKLAVLSNKADAFTKRMVKKYFSDWDFQEVLGMTNEAHKKPNPVGALQIAKTLNLQSTEILYVGDSGIDMQTANNAEMCAVGVLWGFKSKDELLQNGAKYIIANPVDLIELL